MNRTSLETIVFGTPYMSPGYDLPLSPPEKPVFYHDRSDPITMVSAEEVNHAGLFRYPVVSRLLFLPVTIGFD